jgi:hypothetical protein
MAEQPGLGSGEKTGRTATAHHESVRRFRRYRRVPAGARPDAAVGVPCGDEALEPGAYDLAAADRAAQHGLIQDDPVTGGFGAEQVLASGAESHGPVRKIFRGGGKAGYGDGPDVALSLQKPCYSFPGDPATPT